MVSRKFGKVSKNTQNIMSMVVVHSFDIICLSETYHNSETPPHDTRLGLPGYNLFGSDHPSINKGGGVCTYYKSTFKVI